MMDEIRQWMLSVVGCAFAVSLADRLAPEGAVREILRFCGGLTLLLCMLRPLGDVELERLVREEGAYADRRAALETQYRAQQDETMRAVIAERTGAYIEDKARALGLEVTAQVEVRETDGVLLPYRVVLFGEKSAALAALMEEELGLSPDDQEWRERQ